MEAFGYLAAAFAAIIVLGSALVYLHDLAEQRWMSASRTAAGPGSSGEPRQRPRWSARTPSAPGTVVWVRAGEHATRAGSVRPSEDAKRRVGVGSG